MRVNYASHGKALSSTLFDYECSTTIVGMATTEYGADSLNNSGVQNQNRGSRKNIAIGKQTERAVSLVTQHRLNQT